MVHRLRAAGEGQVLAGERLRVHLRSSPREAGPTPPGSWTGLGLGLGLGWTERPPQARGRPGRGDRGHRPDNAAHPALFGTDRRDHRRADRLVGFKPGPRGRGTRASNRIRGLLTQFHPNVERVLGPRLDHPAVTWLLERHGSPAALRKAGRRKTRRRHRYSRSDGSARGPRQRHDDDFVMYGGRHDGTEHLPPPA